MDDCSTETGVHEQVEDTGQTGAKMDFHVVSLVGFAPSEKGGA